MKKSFVDSNKTVSPFRQHQNENHNRSFQFNKSRFTEVTIQTFDKDVPFIAIYKPDINAERRRTQAATKIVASLLSFEKIRVIYSVNRLLSLGPKQKSLRIKALYFGCLFQRISNIRKQRALKGLVVSKIKKNGSLTAAKIVCKIQNSILHKNLKTGLSQLRRNRLLLMVKQLSDNNQLAAQLKQTREQLKKKKQESFSEIFIEKSKKLQKVTNKQAFLQLLAQQNYASEIKNQIKRFEEIRSNGYPKKKESLENESVVAAMSNIIQSYESSLKDYQRYSQQLQNQLAGYKDAEGIQQLKQTVNQKDTIIRDIEAFVNQLGRLDVQLKKFTIQNKFQVDKISSTLIGHDKKLQQRAKSLQGTNVKVLASRNYLTSVVSIFLKKYEVGQRQLRELQQQKSQFQASKLDQIANFQRQIANLKTQLEQQHTRFITVLEKKQSRSGLIDLKRKWKSNDQIKGLVEYLASLHQRIERIQSQKAQISNQMQRQKAEMMKKSQKEIAQLTKKIEREQSKSTKEESKLIEISKKIEIQQSEVLKVEKQLQNKSKSLQKEKLDLTRKLQKEQSEITKIQKQLQNKTRLLDNQRQDNHKKEEQLHQSITKLSQFLRRSVQQVKNGGTMLDSQIGHDITDTLGPIVTPVEQLVDLVNKIKKEHKLEHERYPQSAQKHTEGLSFVESEVKIYRPEVNIDEFEKQIAHRLFSHLQSQLQAKQSEIIKSNKATIQKLRQEQTSISLTSELKYKIQILERQLQAKNSSEELLPQAINKIAELESTIKHLQKVIQELSRLNQELSLKIEQLKTYYQQQITVIQNQFTQTANFVTSQYNQKLGGFTLQQSSSNRLLSQKNEQILSKQLQIQEQIYNLRSQIHTNISIQETSSSQVNKSNEQVNALRFKLLQLQNQLARKTNENQKSQARLKQTQQSLSLQREKVSSLQADLIILQKQLGKSHKESDKLALETHDEVKKVKLVLRALEQELDKKTKQTDAAQTKSSNLQKTVMKLESQLFNSQQHLQETIKHCSVLEQRNMQINSEINQLKAQFFTMQLEVQNSRNNKLYTNSQISSLQNELKEKQSAINNILQQSKASSTSLNTQLFQAREQIAIRERKFEQQLAVKTALINRLEHQLIEHLNTIRNLQQKSILLQQNHKRVEYQAKSEALYDIKDKEIQLLKQQIATLQQFLADISHQYKQLQIKYHQQKLKFGGTPIEKLHNHELEHSMEVIDKAIHQLSDNAPFSEEVRSLIYNNQRLQISIEELQEQRFKLLQKTKSLPERQYVVELVFNVLLGAKGASPQSSNANAIWNDLVKINQKCGQVGELFTQLQKFSLSQLSNKQ